MNQEIRLLTEFYDRKIEKTMFVFSNMANGLEKSKEFISNPWVNNCLSLGSAGFSVNRKEDLEMLEYAGELVRTRRPPYLHLYLHSTATEDYASVKAFEDSVLSKVPAGTKVVLTLRITRHTLPWLLEYSYPTFIKYIRLNFLNDEKVSENKLVKTICSKINHQFLLQ